jgi:glycosyltransferase involved in cell wall biosynthesis
MHAMPGGFDGVRFSPGHAPPRFDIVLVGRLSPIKRVDLYLRVAKEIKDRIGSVSAAVVGDGACRAELHALAAELGLSSEVTFFGHRDDVENVLRESRVFVLTSSSEGVSQAMIQAMLCGLPVVVSQVGDLGDYVRDDHNGYLVADKEDPRAYAERICELLLDSERCLAFGEAARNSVQGLETNAVAREWDRILGGL